MANAQILSNTLCHPSSLTKIYSSLCACCAKTKGRSKKSHHSRPFQDTELSLPNRLSVLELSCLDDEGLPSKIPYDCLCRVGPEDVADNTTVSDWTLPRLVDDSFAKLLDFTRRSRYSRQPLQPTAMLTSTSAGHKRLVRYNSG